MHNNDYKSVVPRVAQPLKVSGQPDDNMDAVNMEKFNLINSRLVQPQGTVGMNRNGERGDLPPKYSVMDVALSDMMADMLPLAAKEQADHMLLKKHLEAKQSCANPGADVLDSGGWCLTPGTEEKDGSIIGYNDNKIVIPMNHVVASRRIVGELLTFIHDEKIASVNDFGAGVGQYKAEIMQQLPTMEWNSYDGAGNVYEYTNGFVNYFDLTLPLELPKADWVVSLEVGEHVPNEYEGMLIRNLHHHNCKGIILSWAVLGQHGHSHINNHSNDYILSVFHELGYIEDLEMKAKLSNPRNNYKWFEKSIMVFRRSVVSPNMGCSL